jgi:hypothetical protein
MFERHSLIPNDHFDLYTVNRDGSGLFQVTNTPMPSPASEKNLHGRGLGVQTLYSQVP